MWCSGTRPPCPDPGAAAGEDGDRDEGGVDPELSLPDPGRLSRLKAAEVLPGAVDIAPMSFEL
jgi:hypothetical protein